MQILFLLPVLLISVSIHEFLHGWVAFLFGDDTARKAGRLTLNPLAHVDVMGMIVVPLILMLTIGIPFGWAKPVPVNSMMMRNPKRNMIWVALAGPVSNVVLGAIGITLLKAGVFASIPAVKIMLFYLVYLNFALATLNLFPIPPLDGSRVLSGLLPRNQAILYAKLEKYGLFIVVGLIYFGIIHKWVYAGVGILLKLFGIEGIKGLIGLIQ